MSDKSGPKVWETTRVQGLLRNKQSGRYYARIHSGKKEIWKSLKTTHFSVAEARLATTIQEHRARKSLNANASNAKMTFETAAALHMKNIMEDVSLKRRTREYWQETHEALLKNSVDFAKREVRSLTQADLSEWASGYAKMYSASRYNHSLSFIRRVLDLAVRLGIIYANPAGELQPKPERPKRLELPTPANFSKLLDLMRAGRGRTSQDCADLSQGLAVTGCRITEASFLEVRDLDFEKDEITVVGDPEERTKNGQIRRVPMIPEAKQLFKRMLQERPQAKPHDKVFLVQGCRFALARACKKLGIPQLTHHDLRHLFATTCIESGVDIPTVSRWLGHRDGGALAMRTYGHLRREHSLAQAQKVSFGFSNN